MVRRERERESEGEKGISYRRSRYSELELEVIEYWFGKRTKIVTQVLRLNVILPY